MSEQQPEPLPVDSVIRVIDYTNVYKNKEWWCAVALINMFGHNKVAIYLWRWSEIKPKDKNKQPYWAWKRKQKFQINFESNWGPMREAIEKYLPRLNEVIT